MKKLMLLLVALAMVLAAGVPAAAQGGNTGNLQNFQGVVVHGGNEQFEGTVGIHQGFEQNSQSGDVEVKVSR